MTLRFWRRYRSVIGLGLVAAVAAGVLIEVVLFTNSNPAYWESAGWRGVASSALRGPLFALCTASAAFVGGTIAVLHRERASPSSDRIPVGAGVLGASAGAAGGWLCLGVVIAVIDGTDYLVIVVWLAVLATLLTAILSAVILSRAARRRG